MTLLKPYNGTVKADWVDYNQHMNVAYYVMAFDHATDAVFEDLGIGEEYCVSGKRSLFAVEQHIVYDHELTEGEGFEVVTYPAALGRKTLHLIMAMRHAGGGHLVATQEHLFVHVDMAARCAVAWGDDVYERLSATLAAYDARKTDDTFWRTVLAPRLNRAILKK